MPKKVRSGRWALRAATSSEAWASPDASPATTRIWGAEDMRSGAHPTRSATHGYADDLRQGDIGSWRRRAGSPWVAVSAPSRRLRTFEPVPRAAAHMRDGKHHHQV